MSRFATAALIAAALTAATASGALAQNASGTVQLTGTVALSCTVAVTDLKQQLNLVSGESSKQVGTVVETCNSGNGYTVTLNSANGGSLKNTSGGNASVSYTVSYDGQNGGLNNGMQVSRSSAQFAKNVPLAVSIQGNNNAVAGSYSDTVTITIAAK